MEDIIRPVLMQFLPVADRRLVVNAHGKLRTALHLQARRCHNH